jgi:hypothetical protein
MKEMLEIIVLTDILKHHISVWNNCVKQKSCKGVQANLVHVFVKYCSDFYTVYKSMNKVQTESLQKSEVMEQKTVLSIDRIINLGMWSSISHISVSLLHEEMSEG